MGWKKDDVQVNTPEPRAEPTPRMDRPAPQAAAPSGERATIGRSITIKGDVTGEEDLLIQGRVEGSVDLKQNSVTVGPEGDVKASIVARVVTVEGKVQGNLTADQQIILRRSARVEGDLAAPSVVLEDGARFRGGVDMGDSSERSNSHSSNAQSKRPADAMAPTAMKPKAPVEMTT